MCPAGAGPVPRSAASTGGSSAGWHRRRPRRLKASHPMLDAVIDEQIGRRSVSATTGSSTSRLQLPRVRPRPGDHRRRPRVPRRVGHPSPLVAAARQPACSTRRSRSEVTDLLGCEDTLAPPDDHAHPHVGGPGARGRGVIFLDGQRAQDDLRRGMIAARPRRDRRAVPARRPPSTSKDAAVVQAGRPE